MKGLRDIIKGELIGFIIGRVTEGKENEYRYLFIYYSKEKELNYGVFNIFFGFKVLLFFIILLFGDEKRKYFKWRK